MDKNDQLDRISSEINDLKEQLEEIGERKIQKASEKGQRYAQMLQDKGAEAIRKGREMGQNVNRYAHDNPWMVAGIGAVAGFLAGAIAMSKKRCRHE